MKYLKTIYFIAIIVVLGGCKEEFLTEVHPTKGNADAFFRNDSEAQEALLSIYSENIASDFYGSHADKFLACFDMVRGDNIVLPLTGTKTNILPFLTLNYNAEKKEIREGWQKSYKRIFRANWVIDNVTDNSAISEEVKKEVLGEAYFLRGWLYFNLTRLFEEVPLVLSSKTFDDQFPEKASNEACWAQVISDMEESLKGLPDPTPNEVKGRANKGVANAMLARVYLNMTRPGSTQYWDKVKQYAEATENTNAYGLEEMQDFSELFVYTKDGKWVNNSEVIWSMGFVYGPYDGSGFRYNNSSGLGTYDVMPKRKRSILVYNENGAPYQPGNGRTGNSRFAVSESLADVMIAYHNLGDKRTGEFTWYPSYEDLTNVRTPQNEWIGEVKEVVNTDSLYQVAKETNGESGEYLHIKKFMAREFIGTNIWDGGYHHSLLMPVIRYADVLLMRAEAEYHLGNEGVAQSYLKQITDRAGFDPNYASGFSGQSLIDEILQQRRVELMFENQRVTDLVRLDMFKPPYVGSYPGSVTWDEKLRVLPIPSRELDLNRSLRQHSLWE